ncbi:N-acetylmuramoyl-L-alanine amidase [Luteibacter sp. W1I16]|uniref:N-acetylmuramoyl-L-alanine amidase family protein n=1 Tax=Luteibacter sp. W1I16 TaxID=3373922 RepID=UPI003D1BB115
MRQSAAHSRAEFRRKALLRAAASIALCLAAPVIAQDQPPPAPEMTDLEWQLLEKRIDSRANEIANSRQFFETDRRPITIVATLDRPSKVLALDIDVSFGRDVGDLPLEDFQGAIDIGIEDMTGLIPGFTTTEWRIGGHDMDYWFNRSSADPESLGKPQRRVAPTESGPPKVVVAAGHGAYFHASYKWTMQRDRVNGVLEDEITQVFAGELVSSTSSNGAEAVRLRGTRMDLWHEPSGMPWANVAARYFLQRLLPENPEIWDSTPGSTDPRREMHQDIRSRPLFANHVGANAVVHIHTNASAPSASGTRVLVHPGRPADLKLAQLTLCSMKELIHTEPRFAGYTVPSQPSVNGKKGENSYAEVPSMIVEVGFHTNESDAAALQDPVFQKLSMKGVAKGMRLYRESASCALFAVQKLEPVTVSIGGDAWLPVTITGNPVYPVSIKATQLNCGKGRCRSKDKLVFSKGEADSYRFNHVCWRGDDEISPIRYAVEAKDADGVRTTPVFHGINCVKAG